MNHALAELIADHFAQPGAAFSIGCFGALAEYHDSTSPIVAGNGELSAVGARGAFRLVAHAGLAAFAYETLAAADDAWQCGIALVADTGHGGPARRVLSELGPDTGALRAGDRTALLFDLGIGAPNVDYCIRTADPALIAYLRGHCGERVIETGHSVLEQLIETSPARVALSAAGRIEVYQRIDRHATPRGPHTHLLPALLASGRTHAANIPLPAGHLPFATLHPPHPLHDAEGARASFDPGRFSRFETLLADHGLPGYAAEKARLRAAIAAGMTPSAYVPPRSRPGRLALRIALRQLLHAPPPTGDAGAWLAHFRR